MRTIGLAILAVGLTGSAVANDFDACVADHMRGVTSDIAAKEIKVACVDLTEEALPDASAILSTATGHFSPNVGWVIDFKNDSNYAISDLTVSLLDSEGNSQDYELGHPFVVTGSSAWNMVLGVGRTMIVIDDTSGTIKDFSKVETWYVVSAKGWHR
jgi:hypothetical protein